MGLLNRLERALGRYAIPNLSLYFVMGQVAFWALSQPFLGSFQLERIALLPALVQQGEVWRLGSFLFLPPSSSPVFLAFVWYLFYLMGSALENYWGVFRFNLFLLLGWALTVGVAFLVPNSYMTNVFLGGSVFLAFAFLNPEFEMMIFFILPVKIKWLALIQWVLYGYSLIFGSWPVRLGVLAAIGNFLIFFTGDIIQRIKTGRRHVQQQARRAAFQQAEDEPRHRCSVCGKTDRTHPLEDFRYGDDDKCYCSEHRTGATPPP